MYYLRNFPLQQQSRRHFQIKVGQIIFPPFFLIINYLQVFTWISPGDENKQSNFCRSIVNYIPNRCCCCWVERTLTNLARDENHGRKAGIRTETDEMRQQRKKGKEKERKKRRRRRRSGRPWVGGNAVPIRLPKKNLLGPTRRACARAGMGGALDTSQKKNKKTCPVYLCPSLTRPPLKRASGSEKELSVLCPWRPVGCKTRLLLITPLLFLLLFFLFQSFLSGKKRIFLHAGIMWLLHDKCQSISKKNIPDCRRQYWGNYCVF